MIDELAQHIHNNGIGILGTSLFKGYLPPDPDTAIAVIDTGGLQPDLDVPVNNPTFQVMIRSNLYTTGKSKLDSIMTAFHKKSAQLVPNGTHFYYIFAIAEGGHIGRDETGRDLFSINFLCKIR